MHPITNIAIRAARKAGGIILHATDRLDKVRVSQKQQNDFVTDIDKKAEHAIIETILKSYPDHAILGEESGFNSQQSDYEWVIDPLDGTANFIKNIPHYCVSIGVKYKGIIHYGVIYDPMRDELFSAEKGGGAQLNGKRIRVNRHTSLDNAILGVALPFKQKNKTQSYVKVLEAVFQEAGDIRRGGSAALDLAYVAAGRLDGYWEIGLSPWDMCAGILMVLEAGGFVTDLAGNADSLNDGNILAASPGIFQNLLKHVRTLG